VSRSLASILRLRSLLEENSRIKLEKSIQHSARIAHAQDGETEIVATSADVAFSALSEEFGASVGMSDPVSQDAWKTALIDGELAHLRKQQLALLSQLIASRVDACHDEFVERRKERLQVETILRHNAVLRAREQERREQRSLDDWFGAMRIRRRR